MRALIAASGSGGHLMPALYIARAIQTKHKDSVIEFVGSGRPLERELIDNAGFARHEFSIVGVKHRGAKGLLQFISMMPATALGIWRLLGNFKPDVVIGVGGYVSVLPVLLARLRGIPTWIHEAELKPGMANGLLALFSTKVSVAFEAAKMPRKGNVVYTGHPIRPELTEMPLNISAGQAPTNILIMGGSQGATALDEAFLSYASELKARGAELWHQSRPENVEKLREGYLRAGIKARVDPFIHDLASAYEWAHLVVSRSGAGAVMEIGVVNKPAILVPYPFAQANHQRDNALVLVHAGKALLVEQGDRFVERLKTALEEVLTPQKFWEIRSRSYHSRSTEAAARIADGCLSLLGRAA